MLGHQIETNCQRATRSWNTIISLCTQKPELDQDYSKPGDRVACFTRILAFTKWEIMSVVWQHKTFRFFIPNCYLSNDFHFKNHHFWDGLFLDIFSGYVVWRSTCAKNVPFIFQMRRCVCAKTSPGLSRHPSSYATKVWRLQNFWRWECAKSLT